MDLVADPPDMPDVPGPMLDLATALLAIIDATSAHTQARAMARRVIIAGPMPGRAMDLPAIAIDTVTATKARTARPTQERPCPIHRAGSGAQHSGQNLLQGWLPLCDLPGRD